MMHRDPHEGSAAVEPELPELDDAVPSPELILPYFEDGTSD